MATTNAVRLKVSPRTPMLPSDALRTQRYLAGVKVDAIRGGSPTGIVQPDVILPSQHHLAKIQSLEPLKETTMAAGKLQGGSRHSVRGVVITKGIAHVSFPGGSMFLPARNPYDRQVLLEHIVDRAHAKERVQVLVDDLRWMVHLRRGPATAHCRACGCVLKSAYSTAEHGEAHCLGCAFGGYLAQVEPKPEPETRSSR